MKKCPCCKKELPFTSFQKDKKRFLGLYVYCRECSNEKSKKSYSKNLLFNRKRKRERGRLEPEKNRQRSKKWYLSNKERVKENVKNYREMNKEWFKKYQKKWEKCNKDKRKSYCKKWQKSKKGKKVISQRNANRKALIRGAEGKFTIKEWEELKKKYNYICPICGKKEPQIKLTRDHIIPITKKGTNYIENIQPLCISCNCKKKDKL